MEIKGFNENEISEQNKEALQSETWRNVRKATEKEIGEATKTEHTEEEKSNALVGKKENMNPFSSGEEKLIAEENEMIASVNPAFKEAMQAQMDLIFKELISWTKQDSEFEKEVLLDHKSMKRCMKFCADKAMGLRNPSDEEKAAARNGNVPIVTPVGSDMLFGWIKEYYDKDDKADVEKEQKAATAKKKSTDNQKFVPKKTVSENQSKKATEKKVTEKQNEIAGTPKKQDKFMEGQMSMFELFGV